MVTSYWHVDQIFLIFIVINDTTFILILSSNDMWHRHLYIADLIPRRASATTWRWLMASMAIFFGVHRQGKYINRTWRRRHLSGQVLVNWHLEYRYRINLGTNLDESSIYRTLTTWRGRWSGLMFMLVVTVLFCRRTGVHWTTSIGEWWSMACRFSWHFCWSRRADIPYCTYMRRSSCSSSCIYRYVRQPFHAFSSRQYMNEVGVDLFARTAAVHCCLLYRSLSFVQILLQAGGSVLHLWTRSFAVAGSLSSPSYLCTKCTSTIQWRGWRTGMNVGTWWVEVHDASSSYLDLTVRSIDRSHLHRRS